VYIEGIEWSWVDVPHTYVPKTYLQICICQNFSSLETENFVYLEPQHAFSLEKDILNQHTFNEKIKIILN